MRYISRQRNARRNYLMLVRRSWTTSMMSCGGPSRLWKRFVTVDFRSLQRSADQLRDELETLRQKLELVLGTDPGVIEQYERRKEEVRSILRCSSTSNARILPT